MEKKMKTSIKILSIFALTLFLVLPLAAFAQKGNIFGSSGAQTTNTGNYVGDTSQNSAYGNTGTQAQTGGYCAGFTGGGIVASGKNVGDIIKYFTCLIQRSIIPLLFALAVLVFVWGAVKSIRAEGSEERAEGRKFMLWGVIALAVMFSVWGLVDILGKTFGVQNVVPQLRVK